jgi:hypothetical protein
MLAGEDAPDLPERTGEAAKADSLTFKYLRRLTVRGCKHEGDGEPH